MSIKINNKKMDYSEIANLEETIEFIEINPKKSQFEIDGCSLQEVLDVLKVMLQKYHHDFGLTANGRALAHIQGAIIALNEALPEYTELKKQQKERKDLEEKEKKHREAIKTQNV
jgi:hypothetical protein